MQKFFKYFYGYSNKNMQHVLMYFLTRFCVYEKNNKVFQQRILD